MIEYTAWNGWARNARLSNGKIELVATLDVGPRLLHFSHAGGPNVFAEIRGEQGGCGEAEWKLRGGHRFWAAPETVPDTYEPDNDPVAIEEQADGMRLIPPPGVLTGLRRIVEVRMPPDRPCVEVEHILVNEGGEVREVAPWALSAMAPGGEALVPLPPKIPHPERLTPNQLWTLWGYTDLSDPRWSFAPRHVLLRQDPARGPTKIGLAHREGWAAYRVGGAVFVKQFERVANARYPDGGVNLELFANESLLEMESLGPLTRLAPGQSVRHRERWSLHQEPQPPGRDAADLEAWGAALQLPAMG